VGTTVVLLRNTMRTPILATLLALSLVACAGEITGGGGGDDDVPDTCGNGTVDTGEECDGTAGCEADCTLAPVPRVGVTIDKATVATQLQKEELVTLTVSSVNGFSGSANITASIVDAANMPLAQLTLEGPTSLTLGAGDSKPALYKVTIPSNATGTSLAATLKLDVTGGGETQNLTSAFTIEPTLIISYTLNTGATTNNHPVLNGTQAKNVTVKRGALIGYKNDDNVQHITHGGGVIPHEAIQDGVSGQPGNTYMFNTVAAAPGSTGSMGCHDHDGPTGYVDFTVE
jgi:hypothetical protein